MKKKGREERKGKKLHQSCKSNQIHDNSNDGNNNHDNIFVPLLRYPCSILTEEEKKIREKEEKRKENVKERDMF